MKLSLIFLLIAVATIGYSQLKKTDAPSELIKTKSGLISGTKLTSGISCYKGIPFAAPPVGKLRWREPQAVRPWSGILKCDHFAPSPMQGPPIPDSVWTADFLQTQPEGEDCLYLNVWTSSNKTNEKKPVIVWIHGGGFSSGSGSVPLYDGEALAKKGVVFVSINYRVGIFGFFAHPLLTTESPHHCSGNYGIFDQVAALQWVKQNIAAFGGDPDNVTIDGQSAGSCSVNTLVASRLAAGLFRRAIAESGFFFQKKQLQPLARAEQDGLELMNAKSAHTLEQMRALKAEDIYKDYPMKLPVVDGYLLSGQIDEIFQLKQENPVDLLIGYNAVDEWTDIKSAKQFRDWAIDQYGNRSDQLLASYPAETDNEAAKSQLLLSRDRTFGFQAYTWAKQQTLHGKNKAWCYFFDHIPPGKPDVGAHHSFEIGYALHNLSKWQRPFTSGDNQLSEQMSQYWINFATNGDPNGKGLPAWPAFDANQPRLLRLGDDVIPIPFPAIALFSLFE